MKWLNDVSFVTETLSTVPLHLRDVPLYSPVDAQVPILRTNTRQVIRPSSPLVLTSSALELSRSRLINLISLPIGQTYERRKGAIQEIPKVDYRPPQPVRFGYLGSTGLTNEPARWGRAFPLSSSPRLRSMLNLNPNLIRRFPRQTARSRPAVLHSGAPEHYWSRGFGFLGRRRASGESFCPKNKLDLLGTATWYKNYPRSDKVFKVSSIKGSFRNGYLV